MANSSGRIYCDRFQDDFRLFYDFPKGTLRDRDMLTLLDSTVDENSDANWLRSIARKHHKSFHPIRHLLFIRFLNDTVDQFLLDDTVNGGW